MGVNLPSDVVIDADTSRPVPVLRGWQRQNIRLSEYRNAAGRAGRLGKRTAGFSVLLADNPIEQRQFVNIYLLGHVEPIESQIPKRPFADVVFGLLASGIADSEETTVEFITLTYAYRTFYQREGGGLVELRRGVAAAVDACLESGLVSDQGLFASTACLRPLRVRVHATDGTAVTTGWIRTWSVR